MQQVNINLLPWRTVKLVSRGRRVFLSAVSIVVVLLLMIGVVDGRLRAEILQLDSVPVDEVQRLLQLRIEHNVTRNQLISATLRAMATGVPDGVVLQQLTLTGQSLRLQGISSSNRDIKFFLAVFHPARLVSLSPVEQGVKFNLEVPIG